MAKKKQKKQGRGFAIFLVIYSLVLLGATAFGLYWLWGCMEAYEASRPHIVIEPYMEQVTKEYIVEHSSGILERVDANIQSSEECEQLMLESLEGEISYARKASACTEDRQVYMVRCGKETVGSFTIVTTQEDKYGFKPWKFQEESYDLSALMGTETTTVVAPDGFKVVVNGFQLDESYITQTQSEPLGVLKDYYDDYELPEYILHTYEVGPFLKAEYTPEIYTPEGEPFVLDESFDPNSLLPVVGAATEEELGDFLQEFLELYVIFAGCANDMRESNYMRVIRYVVPDSSLAQRMYNALDGLQFAQSRGDTLAATDVHYLVEMAPDAWLYDVSYHIDTIGREGKVRTTTNSRIVIVRRDGQLLVESMMNY